MTLTMKNKLVIFTAVTIFITIFVMGISSYIMTKALFLQSEKEQVLPSQLEKLSSQIEGELQKPLIISRAMAKDINCHSPLKKILFSSFDFYQIF
ncbi:hypothetical protein [Succinivibrio faecicola]|uniref:Uncharacterized protein n=1 Tax=Succinivibrio faecicola TaxID=2820300 RepID=A0ABS7DHH3_9GAMM|nr:hypothetical protein [Succinivibrio faecicola]MBW7570745.1 hypothetical protein [Succinivibrio faecicola]